MHIAEATDEELMAALDDKERRHLRDEIMAEVNDRVEKRRQERDAAKTFNPTVDISADARYLWKNFFIWFWLIPALACVCWFIVTHSAG